MYIKWSNVQDSIKSWQYLVISCPGAYAVRKIHLKKTKHYLVYVPVESLLGIKKIASYNLDDPPTIHIHPLVNNDNWQEILK